MRVVRRWTPVALWGAMILAATSIPGAALPEGPRIPGLDKVVHGALYGVLGFLVARAVVKEGRGGWLLAGLAVATVAAADEWHQQWIPGRSADALDWVADVAGATLGASLSRTALVRRETRT